MADARSLILHHYESSPFSEKIRLALALKNLKWSSVEIPVIMPRPDLIPLTGGYRRTPVMQIGSDIYCDTSLILRELDVRYPIQPLALPGHEGLSSMVGTWTDTRWFQASVAVIFGELGDAVPDEFKKDREKLMGGPFDTDAMKAAAPLLRDQWRAQLMWIEERLRGGRAAGTGVWLISTKPGVVDVHAYMNLWFVKRNVPDFVEACFERAPLTEDWFNRLGEYAPREPEILSSADALAIGKAASPRLLAATASFEPQGLAPGEHVAVAPDDYGKEWVEGELVHADAQRVILQRRTGEADTIHVHFPRAGYLTKRV